MSKIDFSKKEDRIEALKSGMTEMEIALFWMEQEGYTVVRIEEW